jgi:hypothetical protein
MAGGARMGSAWGDAGPVAGEPGSAESEAANTDGLASAAEARTKRIVFMVRMDFDRERCLRRAERRGIGKPPGANV